MRLRGIKHEHNYQSKTAFCLFRLTEDAVEYTDEDVVLFGDGGGKHVRCVWIISHLEQTNVCTHLSKNK